jgi:PPOX class probable F420-dependent enzyme
MPLARVSGVVDDFLSEARPAVMATIRSDGLPATTACWYDWRDGQLWLSMYSSARRLSSLRENPVVAITVLGDPWYSHVSLIGRAIEIRADPDMTDIDALSRRYRGEPYEREPNQSLTTVIVEVERWHTWNIA